MAYQGREANAWMIVENKKPLRHVYVKYWILFFDGKAYRVEYLSWLRTFLLPGLLLARSLLGRIYK